MTTKHIEARAYPLEELKGNTLAFASVVIDEMIVIRGVRVVVGKNGTFVIMPRTRDKAGGYHDIAFPLTGELRKEISDAVLNEFDKQVSLPQRQSGYDQPAQNAANGKSAEDVKLDVKIFAVPDPKGSALAFASVGFDGTAAIRGIRVTQSGERRIVSMPKSKDKNGKYHEIAFPLNNDLRQAVNDAVLAEYESQNKGKKKTAEKKPSIQDKLAIGAEKIARQLAAEKRAEEKAATKPKKAKTKNAPEMGG